MVTEMSRKCPYCGEPVPSFSINCPKCYKSIPREEPKAKEQQRSERIPNDRAPSVQVFNSKLVIFLALVPAAVGLMGMGQIYMKEYNKGLKFLAVGLTAFVCLVLLITNYDSFGSWKFLAVIITIFMLMFFIGTYVVQAFDAIVRSLIPVSIKF